MPRRDGERGGGRIRVHERETNDSAAILGADQVLPLDYDAVLNETKKHKISVDTKKDYRRRLRTMIQFFKEKLPDYYAVGVREIPDVDYFNPMKWYYPDAKKTNKYEMIYTGVNAKHIVYFLGCIKVKKDGKLCDVGNLRKFKDAVQWGAREKEELLPSSFFTLLEPFLGAYKKEWVVQKKLGNTEDKSADPITIALYELILKWSLEENNIFVWHWTQAQWNMMARSINVAPLHCDNFRLGTDSIICKYDDSKCDKKAEKLSEKNIYANPFDWRQCYWTGVGVWCALRGEERFVENRQLFLDKGKEVKAASHKYCEQLDTIAKRHSDELEVHMKSTQFNPHGFRKGAATYAASGTTMAPSIPSIARRGEWSIGKILDIYWHFSSSGDQYLGRVVAGLDPNGDDFDVLPPHWIVKDPMSNLSIRTAAEMTFGNILEEHPHFSKVLLRSLACMVYHSDKLTRQMFDVPGHDFNKIQLLQDKMLLKELKPMVTLEPTEGVMTRPTGIPPHVRQSRRLRLILEGVIEIKEQVAAVQEGIKKDVEEVLHKRAMDSNSVSMDRLVSIVDDKFQLTLEAVQREFQKRSQPNNDNTDNNASRNNWSWTPDGPAASPQYADLFLYGGRFNFVPPGFKFPSATIKQGLTFWFCGMMASEDGKKRIRPFRKLTWKGFPKDNAAQKYDYSNRWRAVFGYLEDKVDVPPLSPTATSDELKAYYEQCKDVLKSRVSYYYGDGSKLKNQLSSWAKALCPTVILAKGSASDKSFVPKNTAKPRKKHTRKTSVRSTVKHGARQQKRLILLGRGGERTGRQSEIAAGSSVDTERVTANSRKESTTRARAKRISTLKQKRQLSGNKWRKRKRVASSLKKRQLKAPPSSSVKSKSVCASGNLCAMKNIPVIGHHHCKSCKKKMHGVLCAGKHEENGPMWCLLCKTVPGEVADTSSEESDDGPETTSRFKLKKKESGHVRHYLNNKLRERSTSFNVPQAGAVGNTSSDSLSSSDDGGFGSAFKSAVDDLPGNLKKKARTVTKYSASETGWIPCPRCNKSHVKPTVPCNNPRCSVCVHEGCGFVSERRGGVLYLFCSNKCSDEYFYYSTHKA